MAAGGRHSTVLTPTTSMLATEKTTETKIQYAPLSSTASSSEDLHHAPLSTMTIPFHYLPLSATTEGFHDTPLTIPSTTEPAATAASATTMAASSSPLHTPAPKTFQPSKVIEVIIFGSMIVLYTLMLWVFWDEIIREHWTERDDDDDDGDSMGALKRIKPEDRPSTSALEEKEKITEDLRKRNIKNVQVEVIDHDFLGRIIKVEPLGSVSVPESRYAPQHTDVEAQTPWRRFSPQMRMDAGVPHESPRPSFQEKSFPAASIKSPVVRGVEREDEMESVGCISRIVEMGAGIAAQMWRTEIGENAEDGLLIPVKDDQREGGPKGRDWIKSYTES